MMSHTDTACEREGLCAGLPGVAVLQCPSQCGSLRGGEQAACALIQSKDTLQIANILKVGRSGKQFQKAALSKPPKQVIILLMTPSLTVLPPFPCGVLSSLLFFSDSGLIFSPPNLRSEKV